MSNGNGPDPALFLRRYGGWGRPSGTGKWQRFIETLEPMHPVRIPGGDERARQALYTAARHLGVRIRTRTYNGEAWACLIPDEEVTE